MMKRRFFPNLFAKPRLAVSLYRDSWGLLLFNRADTLKHEFLFLHETPEEVLTVQVKDFLGGVRPAEILLILPRSEVFQKEIALSECPAGPAFKGMLEAKLSQSLPCSVREMAYGLSVFERDNAGKGLIYAVPNQKLLEIMGRLGRAGLEADEIVTEDQPLAWLVNELGVNETVLVLDRSKERVLGVFIHEQTILLSRVFTGQDGDLESVLSEMALARLGQKPGKIFQSGEWDTAGLAAIELQFGGPLHAFRPPIGQNLSAVLWGARLWGKYPAVSLLPTPQKIKKWQAARKKLAKDCSVLLMLFIVFLGLLFNSHLVFLKQTDALIRKEAGRMAGQVRGVKEMALSLRRIEEARESKKRVLELLKELAAKMPAAVTLRELRAEFREINFRGECPTHSALTEAVQVFENMRFIHDVKLEHTRLRKRINQDCLEFEMSAAWGS